MKILKLHVENVKKVKVVDITPKENTVIITGKNGNGKSSTMDSISMVLGGKELIPSKPIREGETTARIDVDLGAYKVSRHWTNPETSYLKVETKEGAKISNGQNILDSIVGELTFDPLAFTTMEPKGRVKILRDLTKLDFSKLDEEFKAKYQERRDIGRDGEKLKLRIESEFVGLPEAVHLEDLQVLKDQRARIVQKNEEIQSSQRNCDGIRGAIVQIDNLIEAYTEDLKKIQIKIKDCEKKKAESIKIYELEKEVAGQALLDTSEIDKKIESQWGQKILSDKIVLKKEVEKSLEETRAAWTKIDRRLKDIATAKDQMIADANMPIKGLAFADDEVSYKGIPFKQLAMSEQIQVSMAISTAMNPKLRIAMIYNGSLLDDDSMKQVQNFAEEKDLQVWIERVADGPQGNAIYIEDGELK